PLWLAPVQVLLIPIKDTVQEYALEVKKQLLLSGIRVEIDQRSETLDKRIRSAEINKIPYCLVLGPREAQNKQVSVRKKGTGDQGVMLLEEFIGILKTQIQTYQ
ncbi:MAG: His/Gly/Thr/Pro-type tRNA ligase C-terminal domain-containing protein, partial [Candidatus Omnitrophica bacterium]|nr:His/Gly/Thr/Pro-type tRNA ligase C-terminal domain-containing protein [Candidatus Omnitrophota bacterium]